MKKLDLKEISLCELEDCLVENGFKRFHAGKIYKSLYNKGEDRGFRFFPKGLERFMEERFYCSSLAVMERRVSREGTEKFLFQLEDGHSVETVFIPEERRGTICVSSQVGCKYGCSFCVSGRGGFVRNLSAAEMVNQVVQVMDAGNPGSVSNIVFMGTGEPLDNYDNLIRAIGILREEQGLYIAKRKLSLSTAGLVPGIRRLIDDKQGIRLSISLHSGVDKIRSELMPINRKFPLTVLKGVVGDFVLSEGFPVFFEYILIKGVNVSRADALSLVDFVKGIKCKINLIPCNPSPFFRWEPPGTEAVDVFRKVLEESRVFYTIRKSRGRDIAAACGQLRAEKKDASGGEAAP